jgi:hypothetical protein
MTTKRARPKARQPKPPEHWWGSWRPYIKWAARAVAALAVLAIVVVGGLWVWAGGDKTPPDQIAWGLTYSSHAAQGLGLDSRATYQAILDELHPKRLRLVAYWTDIEPAAGQVNYSDLDYQVAEAEKRGIPYVIAVGRKVPRWPECYTPGWAKALPPAQQSEQLLNHISRTVARYDAEPHLLRWQVENEPYFAFGDGCPAVDEPLLKREVSLVHSLSRRPIMMTDSGEASNWLSASRLPDVFGSTLYRVVLNDSDKPFHHFLWPEYYTRHANLIRKLHPNVKQVVVAELQAEPWTKVGLTDINQAYIDQTLSHDQFQANIKFASDVGFSEVYLWGAEWWYYRHLHGDDFYWDTARDTFTNAPAR